MGRGGEPGGIGALLTLVEEHTAPLEYDWRTRFGLPLSAIGREVTWREAWSLTTELLRDPSAHTAAAVSGWKYPLSHAAIIAMDNYDLAHAIAAGKKKPKPYPRPWPDPNKSTFGKPTVSQAVVRDALAARHPRLAAQLTGRRPPPAPSIGAVVAYERRDGTTVHVTPAQAAAYASRRKT